MRVSKKYLIESKVVEG